MIKVSEEDLAWLAPGMEPVGAARGLLVGADAIALVTLGGAGACVVTRRDAIEVSAPAVRVVDTIGAGDAFMGAFLARWRATGLVAMGWRTWTRSGTRSASPVAWPP